MNNRDGGNTDRVLRTAAWVYLTPRAVTATLVVSAILLALFLLVAVLTRRLLL